jgi:DNA-binding response OmpR family regulator
MRDSVDRLLRIADVMVPRGGRWRLPSTMTFPPGGSAWQGVNAANGFHILVVEDDEALRRLYAIRLTHWSIRPTVDVAENISEALVQMARKRPDMMIIDLNLPGLSGFQLLRSLNEMGAPPSMVVVVVSGLSAGEIESQGGLPGWVPVFPKPIPFNELAAIAKRAAVTIGTFR